MERGDDDDAGANAVTTVGNAMPPSHEPLPPDDPPARRRASAPGRRARHPRPARESRADDDAGEAAGEYKAATASGRAATPADVARRRARWVEYDREKRNRQYAVRDRLSEVTRELAASRAYLDELQQQLERLRTSPDDGGAPLPLLNWPGATHAATAPPVPRGSYWPALDWSTPVGGDAIGGWGGTDDAFDAMPSAFGPTQTLASQSLPPPPPQALLYTSVADDSGSPRDVDAATVGTATPHRLAGTLYRIGPGLWEAGLPLRHAWDGFTLLARYTLTAGGAPPKCHHAFLDSEAYRAARSGRLVGDTFATPVRHRTWADWARHKRRTVVAAGPVTSNFSGRVVAIPSGGGHPTPFLAFVPDWECEHYYDVDAESLATTPRPYTPGSAHLDWATTLPHPVPVAGGTPSRNLVAGDASSRLVLGTAIGAGQVVCDLRRAAAGGGLQRVEIARLPSRDAAFPEVVLAFGATPAYVVVPQPPLTADLAHLLFERHVDAADGCDDDVGRAYGLRWRPDDGLEIAVIARRGGGVTTYRLPQACFLLFVINAYEAADGSVVVDVPAFDGPGPLLRALALDRRREAVDAPGRDLPWARLLRITLPLGSLDSTAGPAVAELLPGAFFGAYFHAPAISPQRVGREYRYAYGLGTARRPINGLEAVLKIDVLLGMLAGKWHEPGCLPSCGPAFVPGPAAEAAESTRRPPGRAYAGEDEDDGVLLLDVLDCAGRTFLLTLDARTMRELSRAYAPTRLPIGVFSVYVPSA